MARDCIRAQFGRERAAKRVKERVGMIAEGLGPRKARKRSIPVESVETSPGIRPLRIVWEGAQFVHHSLALVNRELCLGLIAAGHELSLLPSGEDQFGAEADPRFPALAARVCAPLSGEPDFYLRHGWPPDFVAPPAGRWLMIQPWEYGVVPRDWVEHIERQVDEVWVPSSYVRQAFIAGGVSPQRVVVVPNGVNLACFRPDAPPRNLPTARRCKLLFVGGTVLWRKGVDVLLEAYRRAFSRGDDVCLLLKDIGRGRLYKGDISDLLAPFERDPDAPELHYVTDTLSEAEMPGLYTACDALLLPFRGEGYGLPVAEALACGLPVVVTRGGACDDFCPDAATYWVPSQRVPCELPGATAQAPWVLEPDPIALAAHLRAIYERPQEARARGEAGASYARAHLGWAHAVRIARKRLEELRGRPPRRAWAPGVAATAPDSSAVTRAEALKALQLARAHARTAQWPAAARALTRALDLDPTLADAYSFLAEVELERGLPEQAADAARRSVALAPDVAEFHTTLGAALRAAGDRRGAETAWRRAVALDAGCAAAWRGLADLCREEGRAAEAATAEERALALGAAPASAVPSAAAEANAASALDAGRAHAEAGRWEEAARALNRTLDFDPLSAPASYLLGYVELQRGALDKALRCLRQAVALAPDVADFHSALGVALQQVGDADRAEVALRRALELDATRGDVWGDLGALYEAQQRWVDAASAYERAGALGEERGAAGVERMQARAAHA